MAESEAMCRIAIISILNIKDTNNHDKDLNHVVIIHSLENTSHSVRESEIILQVAG